jgi:hypothetical protein
MIAFFGAVSFHDGSGSSPPWATKVVLATANAAATSVAILDLVIVSIGSKQEVTETTEDFPVISACFFCTREHAASD